MQSVCHPAFDQLFRCSREVHADGVMVDQATICRYLVIEYGDRLLSFRPSFFYGEDTLVDNEDLPVVKKNPFFTSQLFVHIRYPARDNYDWEQWRDPGRTGRYR